MERRASQQAPKSEARTVRGYAASFGTPTTIKDMTGRAFQEVLAPTAFERTLKEQPDIRLLRDHNPSAIMGRTKSGTLKVGTDAYGLWYECQLPDTQEGRDMMESIRRGDLDSCSFGFTVKEDAWTDGAEMPTRELRDVTLYEVSIVAFPAYEVGTTVDLRGVNLTPTKKVWNSRQKAQLKLKGW